MISVVLATHNEENNLAKCLAAVKYWADEIVVVDGDSTDRTVEIAKQNGAKTFSTTNKTNFHINKQMAMDKAKGDLILQLDADEIVDDELISFIGKINSNLSKRASDEPVAWYLKRKNFFLGHFLSKGGQYPDAVIRLYLRGKAKLPQKDVHEQMVVAGLVGMADGHLLHYSNPTFSEYMKKFQTYTSFKAHQLKENGEIISLLGTIKYVVYLPIKTFCLIYLRHKGFVDGIPGLIFALFSGLHHLVAYLKLWELNQQPNKLSV